MPKRRQFKDHNDEPRKTPFFNVHEEYYPSDQMHDQKDRCQLPKPGNSEASTTIMQEVPENGYGIESHAAPLYVRLMPQDRVGKTNYQKPSTDNHRLTRRERVRIEMAAAPGLCLQGDWESLYPTLLSEKQPQVLRLPSLRYGRSG
jgi:hypothetical protein